MCSIADILAKSDRGTSSPGSSVKDQTLQAAASSSALRTEHTARVIHHNIVPHPLATVSYRATEHRTGGPSRRPRQRKTTACKTPRTTSCIGDKKLHPNGNRERELSRDPCNRDRPLPVMFTDTQRKVDLGIARPIPVPGANLVPGPNTQNRAHLLPPPIPVFDANPVPGPNTKNRAHPPLPPSPLFNPTLTPGPNTQNRARFLFPLHAACQRGHMAVVKALVKDARVNVNNHCCGIEQFTPLHYAVQYGRTEVVKLLLAHPSIDLNARDRWGRTPLHIACQIGNKEVVDLLMHHPKTDVNACCTANQFTPLHYAVESIAHKEITEKLLTNPSVNLNAQDRWGRTPLYVACQAGYVKAVQALMATSQIDVNLSQEGQMTPLHYAVQYGRTEVVNLLLAHPSIDLNARDRWGRTPLHIACQIGNKEVVDLLMHHPKTDVNACCTANQFTPLHYAVESIAHKEITEKLLTNPSVNLNAQDRWGRTPLYVACQAGHVKAVQALMATSQIDVNLSQEREMTPLHCGVQYKNREVVTLLLTHPSHTVDVNPKDYWGRTPICIANELIVAHMSGVMKVPGVRPEQGSRVAE